MSLSLRRSCALGVLTTIAAAVATACTGSDFTQGSVKKVCGQLINAAPGSLQIDWYHDLTTKTRPNTIDLPATAAPDYGSAPWLLVSHNCAHGASITITPSGTTSFINEVKTTDGNYAAIQLDAHLAGTITLIVRQGAKLVSSTIVRTTVWPQPPCPSVSSTPRPSC